jgi:hypothetical protein
MASDLRLKRTIASSGKAYAVVRGRRIVGHIKYCDDSPASRWAWTLAHGYCEDGVRTHGYEATREAALQALSRSWHRE